mmetsp:Transcript_16876/g.36419  ORF Transcript_16876/g.36419 Transcript_16876/m.36419 type:complete len:81 (+) Transcript_16876:229-471(+)
MNQNENKVEVKIFTSIFSKSVNNMQDFLEMKLEVLPHAISAGMVLDFHYSIILFEVCHRCLILIVKQNAKGAGAKGKYIC